MAISALSSDTACINATDANTLCMGTVTPQLVPRHNWSPGPSAANYVAIDGPPPPPPPPDQVWLLWMVRFAASGPPLYS